MSDLFSVAILAAVILAVRLRVAPAARVDDGLLDLVIFETPTKLTMLRHFLSIYRGRHLTKPGVSSFTCTRVELTPAGCEPAAAVTDAAPGDGGAMRPPRGLFPLDVDGDPLGDIPLRVEVVPHRLRVLA